MLVMLLCVEALEDNEVIIAEGVLQVTKISGVTANNVILERILNPQMVSSENNNYLFLYIQECHPKKIIAITV